MKQIVITVNSKNKSVGDFVLNTNTHQLHRLHGNGCVKWAVTHNYPKVDFHLIDTSETVQRHDFYIHNEFNTIHQAQSFSDYQYDGDWCSKLIATSNTELPIKQMTDELIDFILEFDGKVDEDDKVRQEFDRLVEECMFPFIYLKKVLN